MTIDILSIDTDEETGLRTATIAITDSIDTYLFWRGGLPASGNLQTILDAEESDLFARAEAKGIVFDVYDVKLKRTLKGLALVIMDEINILRGQHSLADRTASQIEGAIRNKLKSM